MVSFGHVAFVGIGAYTAAVLSIPPAIKASMLPALPGFIHQAQFGLWFCAGAGGLMAALAALLTGIPLSRMSEGAMAMATLALLVMAHTVFANWEGVTRGTIGVYGIPRNAGLFNMWLATCMVACLALVFKASPTGLRLQTTRDDPLGARSIGIHVEKARLYGWVASGFLTGVSGALWSQNNLAFGPNQFYYAETFTLLSMLVIGGLGSVSGAITGAAVVTAVSELLRNLENGLSIGSLRIPELPGAGQLAVALLIMLILIVKPDGLFGVKEVGFFSKTKTPGKEG